ncbi:hypothetical protein ACQ4PT_045538 [Festuca glaucescens]
MSRGSAPCHGDTRSQGHAQQRAQVDMARGIQVGLLLCRGTVVEIRALQRRGTVDRTRARALEVIRVRWHQRQEPVPAWAWQVIAVELRLLGTVAPVGTMRHGAPVGAGTSRPVEEPQTQQRRPAGTTPVMEVARAPPMRLVHERLGRREEAASSNGAVSGSHGQRDGGRLPGTPPGGQKACDDGGSQRLEGNIPGAPELRPDMEACVIYCTPEVEAAQRALHWSAVINIAGTRRRVAASAARDAIEARFQAVAGHFTVHYYWPADFLVVFDGKSHRDLVLEESPFDAPELSIRVAPWNRQLQATLRRFWYRVHLEMEGVPTTAWNMDMAKSIIGSSEWVERLGTKTAMRTDLGSANYGVDG